MPPLDFGEIKEQNQAICFDNKATQLYSNYGFGSYFIFLLYILMLEKVSDTCGKIQTNKQNLLVTESYTS